jgi:catalase-peroxidase
LQDPIPAVSKLIDNQDIASLKEQVLASGLSVSELVCSLGIGIYFPWF